MPNEAFAAAISPGMAAVSPGAASGGVLPLGLTTVGA